MSNYYEPCFYRIDIVVIPSYIELPCFKQREVIDLTKVLLSYDLSLTYQKDLRSPPFEYDGQASYLTRLKFHLNPRSHLE